MQETSSLPSGSQGVRRALTSADEDVASRRSPGTLAGGAKAILPALSRTRQCFAFLSIPMQWRILRTLRWRIARSASSEICEGGEIVGLQGNAAERGR